MSQGKHLTLLDLAFDGQRMDFDLIATETELAELERDGLIERMRGMNKITARGRLSIKVTA